MVVEMTESQENGFVDLESDLVQTTINVSQPLISFQLSLSQVILYAVVGSALTKCWPSKCSCIVQQQLLYFKYVFISHLYRNKVFVVELK